MGRPVWFTLSVLAAVAGCLEEAPATPGKGGIASDTAAGPGGPQSVLGSSTGHAWCFGAGKGQRVGTPTFFTMWAASPTDAWFLSNHPVVIEGVPDPYSLPNTAPPILGVGGDPTLIHWDGQTFCQSGKGVLRLKLDQAEFNAIWGSSTNDIWTVGQLGSAMRWDGISWQSVRISDKSSDSLVGITGSSSDNIYVLADAGSGYYASIRGGDVFRWQGSSWRPIRPNDHWINVSRLSDIWMDAQQRVWISWLEIVGGIDDNGCDVLLLEEDSSRCALAGNAGSGWQSVRSMHGAGDLPFVVIKDSRTNLHSVWIPGHITSKEWDVYDLEDELWAIRGVSGSEVLVAGPSGLWRWDGTGWNDPEPSSKGIANVWGSGSDNVWGWNGSKIYRREGQTWNKLTPR